jgi:hypothetical protein
MKKVHPRRQGQIESALDKLETAAHVAEGVLRYQYLKSLGKLNEPLTKGKDRTYMLANTACLIGSEVLRYAPLKGRARKWAKVGASALGVLGGLALKYGILKAGAPSATDPAAARYSGSRRRRMEDGSEPLKRPFPAPKAEPLLPPGRAGTIAT